MLGISPHLLQKLALPRSAFLYNKFDCLSFSLTTNAETDSCSTEYIAVGWPVQRIVIYLYQKEPFPSNKWEQMTDNSGTNTL